MLIYIDRLRVVPAKPRLEYIQRMNRGIEDALEKGVPGWWVEKVVRGFIPAEGRGEGGGGGFLKEKGMGEGGWGDGVGELAERQARGFVEEE